MRQLIPICYKEEVFPMMLADAKERARKEPQSDYETKRLAYWRQHNYNLKRLKVTTQEQLNTQIELLNKCLSIVASKNTSMILLAGKNEELLKKQLAEHDLRLKDLLIELLQTIPHEDEQFCMMPDIHVSNCKVLGDITTFKPISAEELAETAIMLKEMADSSKGHLGFS